MLEIRVQILTNLFYLKLLSNSRKIVLRESEGKRKETEMSTEWDDPHCIVANDLSISFEGDSVSSSVESSSSPSPIQILPIDQSSSVLLVEASSGVEHTFVVDSAPIPATHDPLALRILEEDRLASIVLSNASTEIEVLKCRIEKARQVRMKKNRNEQYDEGESKQRDGWRYIVKLIDMETNPKDKIDKSR